MDNSDVAGAMGSLGGDISVGRPDTALQAISGGDKKKAQQSLPDIQGMKMFQGNCAVLRELFLPANVATPPAMPPGFLPPRE